MANEAVSLMKEIKEKRQEKDEYSLFGEQIACKIRKLSTDYAKVLVQHKINNIMFEAELGQYNYPADSSPYISSHITPYYSPLIPSRVHTPSLPYQTYHSPSQDSASLSHQSHHSPSQHSSASQYSPHSDSLCTATVTPQYTTTPDATHSGVSHPRGTGDALDTLLQDF